MAAKTTKKHFIVPETQKEDYFKAEPYKSALYFMDNICTYKWKPLACQTILIIKIITENANWAFLTIK